MTANDYEVIAPAHADEPRALIKMWTRGVPVEQQALDQLHNVAKLPFVHSHLAVMPDVHWGRGATVGSVIATRGAIVPAAVGVDIGCGMMAVRTNLGAADLPDSLGAVRSAIEAAVPHGRTDNGGPNDRGAWGEPRALRYLFDDLVLLVARNPTLERAANRAPHHLGTLGGGNHFIELCLDESDRVWVMLHSGSRGIGNAIGSLFIERAKEHMRRWSINLPDEDLAYLPESIQDFTDYIEALGWAQKFAKLNREVMMQAVFDAVSTALGIRLTGTLEAVNCHHNYVERENHFGANVWLTRKGAVRARTGDMGIIPGSMGARSFIVRGKGNPDSFNSCSHGAGRAMSRGAAKRTFTLDDHALATAGVECRKDAEVLDETPGAYKSIEAVMAAQTSLVDVVHTLKQIVCIKG